MLYKILAVLSFSLFLTGLPLLIMRVIFPLQVGQGEAINVEFARTLAQGRSLYHDPSQAPFLYPAYPPLFPWLQSLLMGLIPNPWLPGRLLAFGGYLACVFLIFLWGRRRWEWPLAILLSGLFGSFPTWALWGTMDRCDALYLFLYFSAFLLLLEDEIEYSVHEMGRKGHWVRIACGGILAALAVGCKQNGLELWLVYGIFCIVEKQLKKFSWFMLFSLPPIGVLFGIEQWRSGGVFLKYVFLWLDTGISWDNFFYYFFHLFLREGGALSVIVGLLLWEKKLSLFLRLQILVSFLSLLSLTRAMSAENYFMEFFLFGIFLTGEGLTAPDRVRHTLLFGPKGCFRVSWGHLLLLIALFASLSRMRWPNLPSGAEINMKYDAAVEIYNRPGEHLALDLDLPLIAGKRIWIQPAEYTAMVGKGNWSLEPLLAEIRAKKYSTIELYDLPKQFLLPDLAVDEILRNYHVGVRKYGRLWLYPNT